MLLRLLQASGSFTKPWKESVSMVLQCSSCLPGVVDSQRSCLCWKQLLKGLFSTESPWPYTLFSGPVDLASCKPHHFFLLRLSAWWLNSKESIYKPGATEDTSSIPGSGGSPGEGNGNPLQYSCLGNPMDRGAWWATAHGVTKSQTWLSNWTHTHIISKLDGMTTWQLKINRRAKIISKRNQIRELINEFSKARVHKVSSLLKMPSSRVRKFPSVHSLLWIYFLFLWDECWVLSNAFFTYIEVAFIIRIIWWIKLIDF